MSMIYCRDCDQLIDSDEDPECFVETGHTDRAYHTIVLCAACRDNRVLQEQYEAPQNGS